MSRMVLLMLPAVQPGTGGPQGLLACMILLCSPAARHVVNQTPLTGFGDSDHAFHAFNAHLSAVPLVAAGHYVSC
jgi:hypothetical protein